jgi:hypothetical protein
MKKLILFLLFSIVGFAQVPQGMSHRGTAYTASGTILQNTPIIINVSILNGNGGTAAYTETHNLTTNNNGQYNINIGQGTNPSALFSSIDWSSGDKWLEIKIAPASNPTNFVTGTSQLMSVPYALYAESSSNGFETVDNIAELRTYNSYANNKIIYVKGYYTAGDGGEGMFIYKQNEDEADNYGTIIKPNTIISTENGRWIRQYSGYMNVEYFGVQRDWAAPTGITNSDRIQAMIDYATTHNMGSQANDVTIFFKSGQYFIDKPIILKDKIKIIGTPGTFLTNKGDNYDYMFKLGIGIVNNLRIENFIINLNNQNNIGGFLIKGIIDPNIGQGGLWNANFKNIDIIRAEGIGINLEGGEPANSTTQDSGNNLPNQFIIFENVRVSRDSKDSYCLKMTGQNANYTFLNCEFRSGPKIDGTCIYISSVNTNTNYLKFGSNAVSFINSGFGGYTRYGALIEHSTNITFDSCFIEGTDIAFSISDSNQIKITNNRFANACGNGNQKSFTQNVGRCIESRNSVINVESNFVAVSDPNSPTIDNQGFIHGLDNNNVINANNNSFQTLKLSRTFGIHQIINIESKNLNLDSKKLVFVTVPNGSQASSNQIDRINSSIIAGETIFLRANQGTIQINAMDLSGTTNKNIYLSGSSSLVLKNGESATFKKIDNIVGNEKCTYQLVSVSKKEDSNWNTSISFSNGVTNYDAASTVRCRNKNGIVYLEGSIKGGATQANGLTYQLFRLPEGFRPSRKCSYTIVRAGNTTGSTPTSTVVGRVDIDANGYVFGVNYSTIWSNLSGISFVVD